MWNDFIQYIINNYNHAPKIVEVAVGNFLEVAFGLNKHLKLNIIMTDIKPSHTRIIQDDISLPNLKIYKNASLIYSIRPPEELHPHLIKVADKVGSDLIIKPLSTDYINSQRKLELINYKKTFFYILKKI
jgi:hypothetical protein